MARFQAGIASRGGVSPMPDKLGALVSVPAPAIVSDPESRAPKRERDIQIMFERERERERDTREKTPLGEF